MISFLTSNVRFALVVLLFLPSWWWAAASSSTISSPPASSLPRSNNKSSRLFGNNSNSNTLSYPPWNTSPLIKYDGFLKGCYRRIPGEWEEEVKLRTRQRLDTPCRIRQVPGDGSCLFHSISLCLQHATDGTHVDLTTCLEDLYTSSQTGVEHVCGQ